MGETRHKFDLSKEPVRTGSIGQLRAEDLDSDRPAVLAVFGKIHGGHPAAPDLLLDLVAVGKTCLDQIHSVNH